MGVSVACLLAASTPKAGNQPEECEDRLAVGPDGLCFAVADGASETSFARLWAGILSERFVEHPAEALAQTWLLDARQAFVKSLDLTRLPWHALEKLRRGSHAALAGVRIDPGEGTFEVRAWGDACVAWVHAGTVACFPFNEVAAMPERPYLISTVPEQNEAASAAHDTSLLVKLNPGSTTIFVMTDAMSRWFLGELGAGSQPWCDLLALPDEAALTAWVEHARARGVLENDDVALIILRLDAADGQAGAG